MSLLVQIATFSMAALALVLFLLQVAAREIGYALGRRAGRPDAPPAEGVGVVITSMLGLLAFVLGLTLAYANTRFQERRQEALAEAQAIDTSWLRAQAVGQTSGAEIARLLEDYTRLRLDFVGAPNDPSALEALERRTGAMQSEIWERLVALARERPDPVVAALMNSLNECFDRAMAQRFAFSRGPAPQLLMLLLGMAMVSMGGLGYQFGLRGRPLRTPSALLLAMWTAVLVLIIDLGAPRLGAVRTDPAPYRWTLESWRVDQRRCPLATHTGPLKS